jgi:hypothetical protein
VRTGRVGRRGGRSVGDARSEHEVQVPVRPGLVPERRRRRRPHVAPQDDRAARIAEHQVHVAVALQVHEVGRGLVHGDRLAVLVGEVTAGMGGPVPVVRIRRGPDVRVEGAGGIRGLADREAIVFDQEVVVAVGVDVHEAREVEAVHSRVVVGLERPHGRGRRPGVAEEAELPFLLQDEEIQVAVGVDVQELRARILPAAVHRVRNRTQPVVHRERLQLAGEVRGALGPPRERRGESGEDPQPGAPGERRGTAGTGEELAGGDHRERPRGRLGTVDCIPDPPDRPRPARAVRGAQGTRTKRCDATRPACSTRTT